MTENKIPDKEERIKICTTHTCDNCPLANIWCFEDTETEQKQLEFDFS